MAKIRDYSEEIWGALRGGAQFSHPHAYFTADSRRVICNADPDGIPHVFMAEIPEGFLEGLT